MILTEDGGTKDDLKLPGFPEGFDEQLKSEFEAGKTLVVTVMSAMGHDQVTRLAHSMC
jgi:translation initiation factor 5A